MQNDVFYSIGKIIERDSKSTTYKFALLRGVIDMIQDNSPYTAVKGDRVSFPMGLLIEKWLLYYYPILECRNPPIPQINGGARLAFQASFVRLVEAYGPIGGFSVFYNDLRNKGIPPHLQEDFFVLARELRDTIAKMPMKYMGRSISEGFYSIFQVEKARPKRDPEMDIAFLIHNFGSFSIPVEYYEAFKLVGSFIGGQDSLLFKWAEFSVNASKQNLCVGTVVDQVLKSPITAREISESKLIYRNILKREGQVHCVWTGNKINTYDIDHMIPFSIWKNNDLWNLLPSATSTNNQKRDKIPSPDLIEKQRDLILHYWEILNESQSIRFKKEIQVALLGDRPFATWRQTGIQQLQDSCQYLISGRGYGEWKVGGSSPRSALLRSL